MNALLTPAGLAAIQEASMAQRERLAALRRQRQVLDFERHLTPEQRRQRAMFEDRMLANALRGMPTCFGELA